MGPCIRTTRISAPWALAAASLCALLLGVACRTESEALYARAQQALRGDDYETAARLFRELTITYPGSPGAARAHYELAEIYHLRIGDPGAAEASLLKILSEFPDSDVRTSAHRLLGRIYERDLDSPEKAPPHYLEVLRDPGLSPEEKRELLLALGDCYYRLEKYAPATDAYRAALELPYAAVTDGAYLRLATLARIEGNPDAAMDLLRELSLRTEDRRRQLEASHGEVQLLIELERFDEARQRLGVARGRFPESDELAALEARIEEGQIRSASFEDEDATVEELQKRIHWGAGRRRSPRER